jgi:Fe-S cluster assembly protein SufD
VQRESREAFHVATFQILAERDSAPSSHSISIGGGLVRNDINAVLAGEGVDCILNGLYLAEGRQHVDTHMRVEHAAAHCASHELYKGVLDGKARAVFDGLIYVHKGAQKTDAKQSNRNLLLSRDAIANSNPQLEIFADDVKCTHGSTVGQLDDDAIFYLRSRGIGAEAARSLLTYAFASDVVERIKVEPVRRDLEELLFARLPQGEVVRQAV